MSDMPIRIGIVEDDPLFLLALSRYLNSQPDMNVTGTAASRAEALQMILLKPLDLILMDVVLSDQLDEGIQATIEILESLKVKIIMMSSRRDKDIILRAFAAGAIDFVPKTRYRQLPEIIRAALDVFNPHAILAEEYGELRKKELLSRLSASEQEIFELLHQGYTRSEIEKKLFKSASTIKNQINSILRKLEVSNSREAVRKVETRGVGR